MTFLFAGISESDLEAVAESSTDPYNCYPAHHPYSHLLWYQWHDGHEWPSQCSHVPTVALCSHPHLNLHILTESDGWISKWKVIHCKYVYELNIITLLYTCKSKTSAQIFVFASLQHIGPLLDDRLKENLKKILKPRKGVLCFHFRVCLCPSYRAHLLT